MWVATLVVEMPFGKYKWRQPTYVEADVGNGEPKDATTGP